MKKILVAVTLLLVFALAFSGCGKVKEIITGADGSPVVTADVETKHFVISEIGVEVDVPADFYTFTRTIDPADPQLEAAGMTADEVLEEMEQYDTYLICYSPDGSYELGVDSWSKDDTELNYGDWSIRDLNSLAESWLEGEEINEPFSVVSNSQTKWIYSHKIEEGILFYADYYTVVEGKVIALYALDYSNDLNAEQEGMLSLMYNSVKIN